MDDVKFDEDAEWQTIMQGYSKPGLQITPLADSYRNAGDTNFSVLEDIPNLDEWLNSAYFSEEHVEDVDIIQQSISSSHQSHIYPKLLQGQSDIDHPYEQPQIQNSSGYADRKATLNDLSVDKTQTSEDPRDWTLANTTSGGNGTTSNATEETSLENRFIEYLKVLDYNFAVQMGTLQSELEETTKSLDELRDYVAGLQPWIWETHEIINEVTYWQGAVERSWYSTTDEGLVVADTGIVPESSPKVENEGLVG